MRKQSLVKVVSFAVAVLLGLVSAQTATVAAPATTYGIPAYANPATQAQINQAYTSQFLGGATPTAPANTAAATTVSPAAAGQLQIGQNMASQQAVIGQGFASQYGLPAWGAPASQPVATAPQPAAVSLLATDAPATTAAPMTNPGTKYWSGNTTQDWATIDWAAQYGGSAAAAPGGKQGTGAGTYGAPSGTSTYGAPTGTAGSAQYSAGSGAAVSLVAVGGTPAPTVDPILAAKIAQVRANYAAREEALELEQERIELEMELGLMNELASLQTAHQAAIQAAAATGAPVTVTATTVATPAPVAIAAPVTVTQVASPVQNSLTLMTNSQQVAVDATMIPQTVTTTATASQAPVTTTNAAPVEVAATPVVSPIVADAQVIATPAQVVVDAAPVAPVNAAPATPVATPDTPAPVVEATPAAPVAPAPVAPVVTPAAPAPVVTPVAPVTPVVAAPATPVLMTEAQIFAKEQQLLKEIEVLKSQRLKNSVTKTLTNYQTILNNQMAEFQLLLDATVSQLRCDATCVSTCAAAALTLDAKALCLDTCLCYATPAVPVTPATPVQTPVAPVAAPVAPVAAAPAIQATPVVAETVAQTVVATPEPVVAGAQQALFLTEDALIMSANGSLSGIIVLAATLALITLIGSAAFHYNAYGKKGFTLKGMGLVQSKKSEEFQDSEEYLLIK